MEKRNEIKITKVMGMMGIIKINGKQVTTFEAEHAKTALADLEAAAKENGMVVVHNDFDL